MRKLTFKRQAQYEQDEIGALLPLPSIGSVLDAVRPTVPTTRRLGLPPFKTRLPSPRREPESARPWFKTPELVGESLVKPRTLDTWEQLRKQYGLANRLDFVDDGDYAGRYHDDGRITLNQRLISQEARQRGVSPEEWADKTLRHEAAHALRGSIEHDSEFQKLNEQLGGAFDEAEPSSVNPFAHLFPEESRGTAYDAFASLPVTTRTSVLLATNPDSKIPLTAFPGGVRELVAASRAGDASAVQSLTSDPANLDKVTGLSREWIRAQRVAQSHQARDEALDQRASQSYVNDLIARYYRTGRQGDPELTSGGKFLGAPLISPMGPARFLGKNNEGQDEWAVDVRFGNRGATVRWVFDEERTYEDLRRTIEHDEEFPQLLRISEELKGHANVQIVRVGQPDESKYKLSYIDTADGLDYEYTWRDTDENRAKLTSQLGDLVSLGLPRTATQADAAIFKGTLANAGFRQTKSPVESVSPTGVRSTRVVYDSPIELPEGRRLQASVTYVNGNPLIVYNTSQIDLSVLREIKKEGSDLGLPEDRLPSYVQLRLHSMALAKKLYDDATRRGKNLDDVTPEGKKNIDDIFRQVQSKLAYGMPQDVQQELRAVPGFEVGGGIFGEARLPVVGGVIGGAEKLLMTQVVDTEAFKKLTGPIPDYFLTPQQQRAYYDAIESIPIVGGPTANSWRFLTSPVGIVSSFFTLQWMATGVAFSTGLGAAGQLVEETGVSAPLVPGLVRLKEGDIYVTNPVTGDETRLAPSGIGEVVGAAVTPGMVTSARNALLMLSRNPAALSRLPQGIARSNLIFRLAGRNVDNLKLDAAAGKGLGARVPGLAEAEGPIQRIIPLQRGEGVVITSGKYEGRPGTIVRAGEREATGRQTHSVRLVEKTSQGAPKSGDVIQIADDALRYEAGAAGPLIKATGSTVNVAERSLQLAQRRALTTAEQEERLLLESAEGFGRRTAFIPDPPPTGYKGYVKYVVPNSTSDDYFYIPAANATRVSKGSATGLKQFRNKTNPTGEALSHYYADKFLKANPELANITDISELATRAAKPFNLAEQGLEDAAFGGGDKIVTADGRIVGGQPLDVEAFKNFVEMRSNTTLADAGFSHIKEGRNFIVVTGGEHGRVFDYVQQRLAQKSDDFIMQVVVGDQHWESTVGRMKKYAYDLGEATTPQGVVDLGAARGGLTDVLEADVRRVLENIALGRPEQNALEGLEFQARRVTDELFRSGRDPAEILESGDWAVFGREELALAQRSSRSEPSFEVGLQQLKSLYEEALETASGYRVWDHTGETPRAFIGEVSRASFIDDLNGAGREVFNEFNQASGSEAARATQVFEGTSLGVDAAGTSFAKWHIYEGDASSAISLNWFMETTKRGVFDLDLLTDRIVYTVAHENSHKFAGHADEAALAAAEDRVWRSIAPVYDRVRANLRARLEEIFKTSETRGEFERLADDFHKVRIRAYDAARRREVAAMQSETASAFTGGIADVTGDGAEVAARDAAIRARGATEAARSQGVSEVAGRAWKRFQERLRGSVGRQAGAQPDVAGAAELRGAVSPLEKQLVREAPDAKVVENLESYAAESRELWHTVDDIRRVASGRGTVYLYHGTPLHFATDILERGIRLPRSGDEAVETIARLYDISVDQFRRLAILPYYGDETARLSTAAAPIAGRWAQVGNFPLGEIFSQLNDEARFYVEITRRIQARGVKLTKRSYDAEWNRLANEADKAGVAQRGARSNALNLPDRMPVPEKERGGALLRVEVDAEKIPQNTRSDAAAELDALGRGQLSEEELLVSWNGSYQDIKIAPEDVKSIKLVARNPAADLAERAAPGGGLRVVRPGTADPLGLLEPGGTRRALELQRVETPEELALERLASRQPLEPENVIEDPTKISDAEFIRREDGGARVAQALDWSLWEIRDEIALSGTKLQPKQLAERVDVVEPGASVESLPNYGDKLFGRGIVVTDKGLVAIAKEHGDAVAKAFTDEITSETESVASLTSSGRVALIYANYDAGTMSVQTNIARITKEQQRRVAELARKYEQNTIWLRSLDPRNGSVKIPAVRFEKATSALHAFRRQQLFERARLESLTRQGGPLEKLSIPLDEQVDLAQIVKLIPRALKGGTIRESFRRWHAGESFDIQAAMHQMFSGNFKPERFVTKEHMQDASNLLLSFSRDAKPIPKAWRGMGFEGRNARISRDLYLHELKNGGLTIWLTPSSFTLSEEVALRRTGLVSPRTGRLVLELNGGLGVKHDLYTNIHAWEQETLSGGAMRVVSSKIDKDGVMRVVLEGVPDEAARSSFQPFETAEQVVGRQTALERLAAKKPIDWTGFHKAPYEEMSKGGGPRLHPSDLAEAELLGIDIRNMTAEEVFEAINTRSPKGPRLYEPHVRSPVLEPDMRFRPQDLNDDVGFVRPNGWVTQRMVVADDGRVAYNISEHAFGFETLFAKEMREAESLGQLANIWVDYIGTGKGLNVFSDYPTRIGNTNEFKRAFVVEGFVENMTKPAQNRIYELAKGLGQDEIALWPSGLKTEEDVIHVGLNVFKNAQNMGALSRRFRLLRVVNERLRALRPEDVLELLAERAPILPGDAVDVVAGEYAGARARVVKLLSRGRGKENVKSWKLKLDDGTEVEVGLHEIDRPGTVEDTFAKIRATSDVELPMARATRDERITELEKLIAAGLKGKPGIDARKELNDLHVEEAYIRDVAARWPTEAALRKELANIIDKLERAKSQKGRDVLVKRAGAVLTLIDERTRPVEDIVKELPVEEQVYEAAVAALTPEIETLVKRYDDLVVQASNNRDLATGKVIDTVEAEMIKNEIDDVTNAMAELRGQATEVVKLTRAQSAPTSERLFPRFSEPPPGEPRLGGPIEYFAKMAFGIPDLNTRPVLNFMHGPKEFVNLMARIPVVNRPIGIYDASRVHANNWMGRALVGYERLKGFLEGSSFTDFNALNKLRDPFTLTKEGREISSGQFVPDIFEGWWAKGEANKPLPTRQSGPMRDLFALRLKADELARVDEYFDRANTLRLSAIQDARKMGLEIPDQWFEDMHAFRQVLTRRGYIDMNAVTYVSGREPGSFKHRYYELMAEGFANGVTYNSDFKRVMALNAHTIRLYAAEQSFMRFVKAEKMVPLRMFVSQETRLVRAVSSGDYAHARNMLRYVEESIRGEPARPIMRVGKHMTPVPEDISNIVDRVSALNKRMFGRRPSDKREALETVLAEAQATQKRYWLELQKARADLKYARDNVILHRAPAYKFNKPGDWVDTAPANHTIFPSLTGGLMLKEDMDYLTKAYGRSDNLMVQVARRGKGVGGFLRGIQTNYDVGYLAIQGLGLWSMDIANLLPFRLTGPREGFIALQKPHAPTMWGKATYRAAIGFFDPERASAYLERQRVQNPQLWREWVLHGRTTGFSEDIGPVGMLERLEERAGIPFRPTKHINQGFSHFLDVGGWELWKSLRSTAKTTEDLEQLGALVRNILGKNAMSQLGMSSGQQLVERLMWYAPSFTRAGFAIMAKAAFDPLSFGGSLALKSIAGLAGTMALFVTAGVLVQQLAENGGDPTKIDWDDLSDELRSAFDPRSKAKFGSFRVGDVRYGLGGNLRANMTLLAALASDGFDDPKNLRPWDPDDPRWVNWDNEMMRYIRGKLHPVPATALDIATGRDYVGHTMDNPLQIASEVWKRPWPFMIQNAIEFDGSWRDRGGIMLAESLGARTTPVSTGDLYKEQVEDDLGDTYENLRRDEPAFLDAMSNDAEHFPELNERFKKWEEYKRSAGNKWQATFDYVDKRQIERDKELLLLASQVREGVVGGGEQYREQAKFIKAKYFDDFKTEAERQGLNLDDAPPDARDATLAQQLQQIDLEDYKKPDGRPDYDAWRAAQDRIISQMTPREQRAVRERRYANYHDKNISDIERRKDTASALWEPYLNAPKYKGLTVEEGDQIDKLLEGIKQIRALIELRTGKAPTYKKILKRLMEQFGGNAAANKLLTVAFLSVHDAIRPFIMDTTKRDLVLNNKDFAFFYPSVYFDLSEDERAKWDEKWGGVNTAPAIDIHALDRPSEGD